MLSIIDLLTKLIYCFDRTCSFVEKAFHVQQAGGVAAIIYDNDEDEYVFTSSWMNFTTGTQFNAQISKTYFWTNAIMFIFNWGSTWIDMIAEDLDYAVNIPALFMLGVDGYDNMNE